MNVIISIKDFTIEVKEEVEPPSEHEDFQAVSINVAFQEVVHKDILKVQLKDTILNYNLLHDGRTKMILILGIIDIFDQRLDESNKPVIPRVYKHIVGNPELLVNEEEEEEINRSSF
mmetsp:Transcript_26849/g.25906  ORF Transcript_26849/g.25906 Transcript_26849/m.25906 type:complete len:117 (+) Transcript_26849:159-509(+)